MVKRPESGRKGWTPLDPFSWWLVAIAAFVCLWFAAVVWVERRGSSGPAPAPAAPLPVICADGAGAVIANVEAAAQASEAAALAAPPVPAPVRRKRLGVVQADGERIPIYTSDRYAQGARLVGIAHVGGKLTDLEHLRETWVILPRHWMN